MTIFKFIGFVSLFVFFLFPGNSFSNERAPYAPSSEAVSAYNALKQQNPDLLVKWGRQVGNPYIVAGFLPFRAFDFSMEMQDKEIYALSTVKAFITLNHGLFSLSSDEVINNLPLLGQPVIIENINNSKLWVARIEQKYNDQFRFIDGELIAIFDVFGQLLSVVGELKNHVPVDNDVALIRDEEIDDIVLNDLNAAPFETFSIDSRDVGIYFYGFGFTLTTVVEVMFNNDFYRYVIDAYSGTVLASIKDQDEETVHRWVMPHEASVLYNEPAFLSSQQDAGNMLFIDGKIHVYDASIDSNAGTPITAGVHAPNDTWFFKDYYNVRIASYSGGIYYNNDTPTPDAITSSAVDNFSVYYQMQQFLERFEDLGFVKDGRNYPEDHSLVVIVNRPSGDSTFCSGGGSCNRRKGFPRESADGISQPLYTEDQCNWGVNCDDTNWHPSISLLTGDSYGSPTASRYYIPLAHIAHELTHYVQRRYFDPGDDEMQVNEGAAISEGTAYYFSASLTKESPGNLYLDELRCYSNIDDSYSNPVVAIYQPYYNCCVNEHNHGFIVSQSLWDLERGWSAEGIPDLGATYVQGITMWAFILSTSDMLINEFKLLLMDLALIADCPIGSGSDCAGAIEDAFAAHGVHDGYYYNYQPCTLCGSVRCFRDYDNCLDVPEGACYTGNSPNVISCIDACTSVVANCFYSGNIGLCKAACIQEMWSWEKKKCIMVSTYPGNCISGC